MEAAVGAFMVAAGLVLLTAGRKAAWRSRRAHPVRHRGRHAGGRLLRFVLAVFESAQTSPALVLPLIGLFLVARLVSPAGGMLVVVAAGIALAFALELVGPLAATWCSSRP